MFTCLAKLVIACPNGCSLLLSTNPTIDKNLLKEHIE